MTPLPFSRHPDDNLREMPCDQCGGDGGWEETGRWQTCHGCEGTGRVWVEFEPVTEEEVMQP